MHDELAAGEVTVKDLAVGTQERVAVAALPEWWKKKLTADS
jgi:histidyl-tRNA synthetase